VCRNKKAQHKTGPVMDIAHQREGKHKIHKSECPHEKSKLEDPGDKTDQEPCAHSEIQPPSYNLHIHENRHTLSCYSFGFVEKGDGTLLVRLRSLLSIQGLLIVCRWFK
jgi:hypothetical protein